MNITEYIDDKNLAQALDCCLDESKKVNMPTDVLIRFICKSFKNNKVTGETIGNLFKEQFIKVQNNPDLLEKIKAGKTCLCRLSINVNLQLKKNLLPG
jgi:hypothetical protein